MRRRVGSDPERGAVAVEFAILLPLLVLILFGILQFGLYFFRWQGMQNMAQVGARAGSVGLTVQEISDRVFNANSVPVQDADVDLVVERITGGAVERTYDLTAAADLASRPCEGLTDPDDYLLRVSMSIDPSLPGYQLSIPLWGAISLNYRTAATVSCLASS